MQDNHIFLGLPYGFLIEVLASMGAGIDLTFVDPLEVVVVVISIKVMSFVNLIIIISEGGTTG